MDDPFLLQFRSPPRPEFLSSLKARLDQQRPMPNAAQPWAARVRNWLVVILIGGAAFAVTSVALRGLPESLRTLRDDGREPAAAAGAVDSQLRAQSETEAPAPLRAESSPTNAAARELALASRPPAGPAATSVQDGELQVPSTNELRSLSQPPQYIAVPAGVSRDHIEIVGSHALYPYTEAIAEQFARTTHFKSPTVRKVGSGGGMLLFCNGVGPRHPDIVNGFGRRMNQRELDRCMQNGVTEIVEAKLGYQAIVLARARSRGTFELSPRDVFLALAASVPDPNRSGGLRANTSATWSQVNPSLGDERIEVLGPPSDSPFGQAFIGIVMAAGCRTFPWVAALREMDLQRHQQICGTIRKDGVYVEVAEATSTLLVSERLAAHPGAVGVLDYESFVANSDALLASPIDGVKPTLQAIRSGQYTGAGPFYLYIKKAHLGLIPGLREFLTMYMNELEHADRWARFIPLEPAELARVRADVVALRSINGNQEDASDRARN